MEPAQLVSLQNAKGRAGCIGGPVMMRDWPTKLNRFDRLWSVWLRSMFIQLPWIICFILLGWFVMSSQGISLTEYPVEHPWIRYVCFGAVLSIG